MMEERCRSRAQQNRNQDNNRRSDLGVSDNERLQKALAERDHFLELHPQLRAYQAEIDRILDRSGNRQGRLAVLGTLMQGKLLEMQKELFSLTEVLRASIGAN